MTQRKIKRLLLIGGGHSHVEVLRQFGQTRVNDVDVTLVNSGRYMMYSGMLPGVVAGHYAREQSQIDLRALATYAGATFIDAACMRIDASKRQTSLANGLNIEYDLLSLNVGTATAMHDETVHSDNVIAVRPLEA